LGSAPDPAGGAHSAPPGALTGFEGVLLPREGKEMRGKGREGGRGRKGRKGKGREGRRGGRGRKGRGRLRHGFWGDGRPCLHLKTYHYRSQLYIQTVSIKHTSHNATISEYSLYERNIDN